MSQFRQVGGVQEKCMFVSDYRRSVCDQQQTVDIFVAVYFPAVVKDIEY